MDHFRQSGEQGGHLLEKAMKNQNGKNRQGRAQVKDMAQKGMFEMIDDSLNELATEIAKNQINNQRKKNGKKQAMGLGILDKPAPQVISEQKRQTSDSEEDLENQMEMQAQKKLLFDEVETEKNTSIWANPDIFAQFPTQKRKDAPTKTDVK